MHRLYSPASASNSPVHDSTFFTWCKTKFKIVFSVRYAYACKYRVFYLADSRQTLGRFQMLSSCLGLPITALNASIRPSTRIFLMCRVT